MAIEADYLAQISDLKRRLDEAVHTLEAIQAGSVDAVVVNGPNGAQIYTLESPDQPFRTFVEGMQEGALTLGRDGEILYANASFAALVQREAGDILGLPFSQFVVPSYHGTCEQLLQEGFSSTVKQRLRLEAPSGTVPVQVTVSPLAGGEQPTSCAVVVDLREREQADRARAAREAAEQANAAKDRFLAVLGHELRSPLNTVLGWAQILGGRTDLDPVVQKAVKTIERNARSQAQLISELLDVSRIISGKLHLEFEVVDLKAIVTSALAAGKLTLDKRVEIRSELPEGDACVLGDTTRLQQIVTNLLGNALKFTDDGGNVEVRLSCNARQVELSVADTGSGIDPEQIDVIFELFQQAATQRQRKGGLGLGLSITKQLVEAHGGRIQVQSPGAGLGATFTVQLPRATGPTPSADDDIGIDAQLTDRRILVIDDDADILELMRYALEHRGARVDTVQTAAAALEKLAHGSYDVLISDLGLPEQDGLALIREVRARGNSASSLRAVALTGYASEADARLCASAGFELHLVKPISPWEVARAVTGLLETPAPSSGTMPR
jgi:PAS domain S-box-containing protein